MRTFPLFLVCATLTLIATEKYYVEACRVQVEHERALAEHERVEVDRARIELEILRSQWKL